MWKGNKLVKGWTVQAIALQSQYIVYIKFSMLLCSFSNVFAYLSHDLPVVLFIH